MHGQYYVATPTIILYTVVSSPDCSRHGVVPMTTCTCGARTYMITFLAKVVANSSLYQGVPPPSENPESAPAGDETLDPFQKFISVCSFCHLPGRG